jgi:uncharacterized protein (DUF362 family)/Pyruvate/2-oxoacid:ferredoxin oxidoreductase delta subunit
MKTSVSIVKCDSYNTDSVLQAAEKAVDLLGGIAKFVKPESSCLVKPNLLMAIEPESGIDTHPEVVRAVIKILKQINCKIFVGDGPCIWGQAEKPDEVYERSGIKRICEEEGVSLVKFDKQRWRGKFPLTAWLDECDYLVNVPKLKTHEFTILTGAVKNLYGLLPGTFKTEIHKKYSEKNDFANILADIYQEAKPALTVIDGIIAMEGDGPASSGKLRDLGLLFAGSDCVAIDSVIAIIMGLKPFDIISNKVAVNRGLGVADINSIEVLGASLEDVIQEPFKLPVSSMKRWIPKPIIELAKKLIRFYPKVNYTHCTNCGACIEACPEKLISRKKGKIIVDYSRCISCFCCQEACPASAIKVKKSIFAKIIGL